LNNYEETLASNQNLAVHCNLAEQQLDRQSHSWQGVNALEMRPKKKVSLLYSSLESTIVTGIDIVVTSYY